MDAGRTCNLFSGCRLTGWRLKTACVGKDEQMNGIMHKSLLGIPVYRWAILGLLGLLLLGTSIIIRDRLDIDWTTESLRSFVQSLGFWGPLSYMGILTFRFVFLIPTGLLLLASGIMFGPIFGTLYAGLGMFGSGMLKYVFVQIVGRDAVLDKLPARLQDWVTDIAQRKMSVWALAGVCAYPFFPKHVFQFAAILSGMHLVSYVFAVLIGSFVRAAIFANIGEAIYSGSGLMAATAILIAGLVLPICVPAWRRWLLSPIRAPKNTALDQGKL
ncbi:MAG: VTT domain-containing protein [Pseudomonadota bacterium]